MTQPKTTALPVAPEHEHLWYAHGLRFQCTGCGNCCSGGPGYVWLTLDNIAAIAAHLDLTPQTFTTQYVRRVGGGLSLVEKPGYDCIFLQRAAGHSRCAIYPVRPAQCRTWPFWNQNLASPDHWTQSAARCPGMCDPDAPLHNAAHIEKHRTHPDNP